MKEANFGCIEAQAYLPLYVGDDLDAPAIHAVRAHLEGCATCAASLAALRGALAAFATERERVDAKIDLWAGIERELASAGMLTRDDLTRDRAAALATGLVAGPIPASMTPSASQASAPRAGRAPASLRRWSYLAAAAAAVLIVWRLVDASPAGTSIDSPNSARRDIAKSETPEVRIVPQADGASPGTLDEPNAIDGPAVLDAPARTGTLALVGDPSVSPTPIAPVAVEFNALPVDGLRRLSNEEALLREHLAPGAARNGAYSLAGSQGLR